MSEDDGWEFVNLGDQQSFGIKTAGLEEKATACQMLVSTGARHDLSQPSYSPGLESLTGPSFCFVRRCATPKS